MHTYDQGLLKPLVSTLPDLCSLDDFIDGTLKEGIKETNVLLYLDIITPFFESLKDINPSIPSLLIKARFARFPATVHHIPLTGIRYLDPDSEEDIPGLIARSHAQAAKNLQSTIGKVRNRGLEISSIDDRTLIGKTCKEYSPDEVERAVKAYFNQSSDMSRHERNYAALYDIAYL